jgi:hypothetical protein
MKQNDSKINSQKVGRYHESGDCVMAAQPAISAFDAFNYYTRGTVLLMSRGCSEVAFQQCAFLTS